MLILFDAKKGICSLWQNRHNLLLKGQKRYYLIRRGDERYVTVTGGRGNGSQSDGRSGDDRRHQSTRGLHLSTVQSEYCSLRRQVDLIQMEWAKPDEPPSPDLDLEYWPSLCLRFTRSFFSPLFRVYYVWFCGGVTDTFFEINYSFCLIRFPYCLKLWWKYNKPLRLYFNNI